jgi:hypothetical protein
MTLSSKIRYDRDLFVASRNPFAARWTALAQLSAPSPFMVPALAAGPSDDEEEPDEDEDDDDDDFDEDEDGDEEDAPADDDA